MVFPLADCRAFFFDDISQSILFDYSIQSQPYSSPLTGPILGGRHFIASADALLPGLVERTAFVGHRLRPRDLDMKLANVFGLSVGDPIEEWTNGIWFNCEHGLALVV